MNLDLLYAHTPNADGDWDKFLDHARLVASTASEFASPFGAGDLAAVLGFWHDLGKINPEFQKYLKAIVSGGKPSKGPPHAVWGAALVYNRLLARLPDQWEVMALPIAGHHGGLGERSELSQKLEEFIAGNREALAMMIEASRALELKRKLNWAHRTEPLSKEFFVRMVFSALVDADYLATEAHFERHRAPLRAAWPSLGVLWQRFQSKQPPKSDASEGVNRVRNEVYESCLEAAKDEAGFFRLRVPTGGGKTRSGLAFALKHAEGRMFRIVVALPYTSIIDQTAGVYRDMLGEDALLEHHSQTSMGGGEEQNERALRLKLASENWDAPLIVTTTVQLFESLLANKTSKTRKLHNLARSVIVLDEVQTLPPELLRPTLDVLRLLVAEYGVTVVFSTATQPAFDDTPYLKELEGVRVREIVPEFPRHFKDLRRVRFSSRPVPISWVDLATEVTAATQVLVVLNTRRNALALLDAMGKTDDCFHLSTLMCGAHRKVVLEEVTNRLKPGRRAPVRLISTQVVEAGVDLDFPVVYRAMGPLDRIVQAAGRCNRHGMLAEGGRVIIFEPESGGSPRGAYYIGLQQARLLLSQRDPEDLHDPALYHEYYQRLFADVDLDKEQIQEYRKELNYPEVAARYRLIEDTVPVVVNYGPAEEHLTRWSFHPSRETWRALQPFLVNLFADEERRFANERWLQAVGDGLYRWLGRYDKRQGIVADALDPSDLIL